MTLYLSTLDFDAAWLDLVRSRVPGVEVRQIRAATADDIPDAVWREVEVLHTSAVLPDPGAAPRLRWVQLDTSGVDHVVGTPLWDSRVDITTIGGVSPVPLAEYVICMILGFAHRLPALLQARETRTWPDAQERWRTMLPARLSGATVTIVGYGRIGREIGRLARAHRMDVVGVTRSGAIDHARDGTQASFGERVDHDGVEVVDPGRLHEVLGRSDYVVVVVPLTTETRGMIDAAALAATKPGATLVNVARGGIVDEEALLAALRSGHLAGAALDVFDVEPLPADSVWWDEPNVFVTPHASGLAPSYAEQVLDIVTSNLARFERGEPLLNLVNRDRGY
ncbi:MAG: D-2-hydroxyacid dehydrogenase [Nocardioides sp.]|uniref:D-2-hydroxyacid dehydrogenase n=1 Tax=Nocardioides sp. TaxID=35761 RepID=UPI0039E40364